MTGATAFCTGIRSVPITACPVQRQFKRCWSGFEVPAVVRSGELAGLRNLAVTCGVNFALDAVPYDGTEFLRFGGRVPAASTGPKAKARHFVPLCCHERDCSVV